MDPDVGTTSDTTNLLQSVGAPSNLAVVIFADDIATMDIMCSHATVQKREIVCKAMLNTFRDYSQIKALIRDASTPLAVWINWGEQTARYEAR